MRREGSNIKVMADVVILLHEETSASQDSTICSMDLRERRFPFDKNSRSPSIS